MNDTECPWLLIKLQKELFGIKSSNTVEMLILPKLVKLASAPDYVRGMMKLRDKTIMVIDLRKKLDMKTSKDEINALVKLLEDREQDHKNWLMELENSTKEAREFKLSLDPHKCAFGKWYDNYTTTNLLFANHLKKFDVPHKKIHALGKEVYDLIQSGDVNKALDRIENARETTLAELLVIFENSRKLLRESHREIVIVIRNADSYLGISVDSIESIEQLRSDGFEKLHAFHDKRFEHLVEKTGKTQKEDKIVMLIDTDRFFGTSEIANVPLELVETE